jgi:hypothetical protein
MLLLHTVSRATTRRVQCCPSVTKWGQWFVRKCFQLFMQNKITSTKGMNIEVQRALKSTCYHVLAKIFMWETVENLRQEFVRSTTRNTCMQQPLAFVFQTLFQRELFGITSKLNACSGYSHQMSHGNTIIFLVNFKHKTVKNTRKYSYKYYTGYASTYLLYWSLSFSRGRNLCYSVIPYIVECLME